MGTGKSALITITNCHRLDDLKNKNLFSHSSGGWDTKVRVPLWLGSSEVLWPAHSPFLTAAFPQCLKVQRDRKHCSLVSLLTRALNLIMRTPTSWLHLNLNIPQGSHLHILSLWWFKSSTGEFWREKIWLMAHAS